MCFQLVNAYLRKKLLAGPLSGVRIVEERTDSGSLFDFMYGPGWLYSVLLFWAKKSDSERGRCEVASYTFRAGNAQIACFEFFFK